MQRGTLLTWRTDPLFPDEVVDLSVHRFPLATPAENNVGVVTGAGIEFRAGTIRLSPEFRYTRWDGRYWESFGSRGPFTGSNLDQAELLLGIRF